jgi:septal ring factor EnvC (AmiA/AmiB activator)
VRYQTLTEQLGSADARLQARRAEAVELRATSGRLLAAANTAATERRQLLARVASERDAHTRVIDELERARQALDGAVATYRPDVAAPASTTAPARPVAPTSLTALRRRLPWPLPGRVQQPFGRRREPRFGTTVVRNGVDIAAPAGAEVRAIHGGTVAFADEFDGFGRVVIVDHGQQAFTLYGYLSSVLVAPGASIAQNTVVGQVGEAPTGGPSLYFELRIDGRPVDPLQWLEGR